MPEARFGGTLCHWTEQGIGPPILMLHCMLAHGGAWRRVAERLPEGRAVMPDLVSNGRSGPHDPARDLHDQATEMVRALAERLADEAGGPVEVAGHSFGGTLALRLAVEAPHLVRALTLVEPVYFAAAAPEARRAFEAGGGAFLRLFHEGQVEAALQMFLTDWGGPGAAAVPEPRRSYFRDRLGLVAMADAATLADRPGVIDGLDKVRCPVLLVEGGNSPAIVSAIQDGLAARLPQAERLVVAGAGHDVVRSHPQSLAAEMARHHSSMV